jgi:NADPH:quinone reductase-like Zn-dependent oxidoreductase
MRAVQFSDFGDAEVLQYGEAPTPSAGPGEVVVNLKAAALNHLDLWIRSGQREKNIPLPHILGCDGAGVISEIGLGVDYFKLGDRVLISPGLSCGQCEQCLGGQDNICREYRVLGVREHGTYAEYVKIPAINAVPMPEGIDFQNAAAFPLVFLTAWHMLVTLAKIRPNETVLIHGAGSGVGSAAIQIAKLFGAHVITTAGHEEKLLRAKKLGADDIINYHEKDFVEEVKRLTEKRGVDVVFEHIGGEVLEKSLTIISKGGRLVTCGATTEFLCKVDIRYLYSRHLTLFGSFMGTKNELREVVKFLANGKLKPVIDKVFHLKDVKEAHRRMEERKNFGKIVLSI